MGQWEILRIIREHTSPYARGFLGRVCPEGEHKGLERDVGELLDCIESSTNCGPSTKERCAQLDSGRVSFIHLPHIFARGALISSNSDDDGCQVVEVVSCEINSASASGDVCEVLYWHFRWSRRAVIKYNGRFRVQHFTGTKRLKDLPFSPIATYSNPGETIESYYLSVESGGEALSFLKSLPPPESEPYPRFSYVQNILGQPVRHFPRLDAFDLSSKKWIKVATTSLQPIPDTESTLNDYEVNTVLKSSLDLEVKSYASQRQRYYQQLHDFVGVTMPPGLFYHFHGPRGVGKTLLAEILAESHRLPLMLLRLTDFGLDLSTFGENLKELMHLSSRWGAVLVILASYNGIIIFFTSEIAQLDRSLKDKLRLVSFSNLSAEQMMHIFKVFLKRAALSELDSGTEIEMISWFEDVITDWTPSGQQILSLVRISFDQAVSQRRQAQLADLVAAYSAKTGSLNFWGFETEAVSQLLQSGGLRIVDWGWPRKRWSPQIGCIICGGDASIMLSSQPAENKEISSFEDNILSNFPWLSFRNKMDRTPLLERSILAHAQADPMKLQGLSTFEKRISQKNSFHIVFYELLKTGNQHTGHDISRNVMPFYGEKDRYLRKSAFTVFTHFNNQLVHIPEASPAPLDDPIHWTMLCLISPDFGLTEHNCRISESPSLRAQSLHYVANALSLVTSHWREFLQQLNRIVDNGNVLREPNRLQDILFDDNTFSISKRYFWAINLIHEIISLLDDNLEKWDLYKRASVVPFLERYAGEVDEDWQRKAYAAMVRNDKAASEACAELELIRDAFQETLKRITLMRDGLFNASSVMEARASTQLGENVKLLTFISIFFLPLGLCNLEYKR
uniref:Putative 26S protease regulatory subunit like n=1 Tax=Talaromyces marneffei PM1 TaxID=1077442 RepID=A0A093XC24_TALMA